MEGSSRSDNDCTVNRGILHSEPNLTTSLFRSFDRFSG